MKALLRISSLLLLIMWITPHTIWSQNVWDEAINDYPNDFGEVVSGDINNDGLADFVITGTYQIVAYLNRGKDQFEQVFEEDIHWNMTTPSHLEDFDGDGNLDLLTTAQFEDRVVLYLGNGDGSFSQHTELAVSGSPNHVTVSDFDKDGDLDMAVTRTDNNTVTVYRGNGNGGFFSGSDLGVSESIRAIGAHDINGNGYDDLVFASLNDGTVYFYTNDQTGGFQFSSTVDLSSYDNISSIDFGDVTGNGNDDVILGNEFRRGKILEGDGAGNFSIFGSTGDINSDGVFNSSDYRHHEIKTVDLNGDVYPDLIIRSYQAGQIIRAISDGDGTFSAVEVLANKSYRIPGLAVADFDNDNDKDIVYSQNNDSSNPESLFYLETLNSSPDLGVDQTTITYSNVGVNTTQTDSIRIINKSTSNALDLTNISSNEGAFVPKSTSLSIPAGSDGYLKVDFSPTVVQDYSGTLSMSTNDPNQSTFEVDLSGKVSPISSISPSANSINVSRNSDIEIQFGTAINSSTLNSDNVQVSGNQSGAISFSGAYDSGSDTYTINMTETPFYGETITVSLSDQIQLSDGSNLSSYVTWSFTIEQNAGSKQFAQNTIPSDNSVMGQYLADLNDDGNLDLLYIQRYDWQLVVQMGLGDGSFGEAQKQDGFYIENQESWHLTDFNKDGIPDIVIANSGNYSLTFFRGDGKGQFKPTQDYLLDTFPHKFKIADVNGDGQNDYITWSENRHKVYTVENGSLQKVDETIYNDWVQDIEIGDLTGDNRNNVVVVTQESNAPFRVYSYSDGFERSLEQEFFGGNNFQAVDLELGDINNNGRLDYVLSEWNNNQFVVLPNDGTGNIGNHSSVPHDGGNIYFKLYDIDGDGYQDLIYGDHVNENLGIFEGSSSGFVNKTTFAIGNNAGSRWVTLGDVDNNGTVDVLTSDQDMFNLMVMNNRSTNPSISFDHSKIDLGTTTTGSSVSTLFAVQNTSASSTLNISEYSIQNAEFNLTPSDFPISLNPGESTNFSLEYSNDESGLIKDTLILSSNDPIRPEYHIPVEVDIVQTNSILSGVLTQDLTLTKDGSPYLVEDNLTVDGGVTLRAEPGVVISVGNRKQIRFIENANLEFSGIESDSVHVVGDNGKFHRIYLDEQSEASFKYVSIDNAVAGIESRNAKSVQFSNGRIARADTAIRADGGSNFKLDNSIIEHSRDLGIDIHYSNVEITNSVFRNNAVRDIWFWGDAPIQIEHSEFHSDNGIQNKGGSQDYELRKRLTLNNNYFFNPDTAVQVGDINAQARIVIRNNTFNENTVGGLIEDFHGISPDDHDVFKLTKNKFSGGAQGWLIQDRFDSRLEGNITENIFDSYEQVALYTDHYFGSIERNQFIDNDTAFVHFATYGGNWPEKDWTENIFRNNNVSVFFDLDFTLNDEDVYFQGNSFYGNQATHIGVKENNQTGDILAQNNYWGTSDSTTIADNYITDFYDSGGNSQKVLFMPVAEEQTISLSNDPLALVVRKNATGQVELSWNPVYGAEQYRLYYNRGSGSVDTLNVWTSVDSTNSSYAASLPEGQYEFAIRAVGKNDQNRLSFAEFTVDNSEPKVQLIEAIQFENKLTLELNENIEFGSVRDPAKWSLTGNYEIDSVSAGGELLSSQETEISLNAPVMEQVDGKIYVIRSNNSLENDSIGIYDPVTDRWKGGTPQPTDIGDYAGRFVYDGKIYVLGGYHNGASDKVYYYDPKEDDWTEIASLNQPRADFIAAEVDGYFYAMGGNHPDSTENIRSVERYDPATQSWEIYDYKSVDNGLAGYSAMVIDKKIYFTNSNQRELNYYDPVNKAFVYDNNIDWENNKHGVTAKRAGNYIYFFGGQRDAIYQSEIVRYDLRSGSYEKVGDLSTPRDLVGAAHYQDHFYIVGGQDSNGDVRVLDEFQFAKNDIELYLADGQTFPHASNELTLSIPAIEDLHGNTRPSSEFTFHPDDGNRNPNVEIGRETFPAEISGDFQINYQISDEENDAVSLLVEYTLNDGEQWHSSTLDANVTDLSSDNYSGTVNWLTNTDFPEQEADSVRLRIVPQDQDEYNTGIPIESGFFTVDNLHPHEFLSLGKDKERQEDSGDLKLGFAVRDTSLDQLSLVAQYSTDSMGTWKQASLGSASILDLNVPTYADTLIWSSAIDLKGVERDSVYFRTMITDGWVADTSDTVFFKYIDNNVPPEISSISVPSEEVAGLIDIPFNIKDPDNEEVNILMEYSIDDKVTWDTATTVKQSINGEQYIYAWDSGKDLYRQEATVYLRITPSDLDTGNTLVSNSFALNNIVNPKFNSTNATPFVAANDTLKLTFSRPIDLASVNTGIAISGSETGAKSSFDASLSTDRATVKIVPDEPFSAAESISITISGDSQSGLKDDAGNWFDGNGDGAMDGSPTDDMTVNGQTTLLGDFTSDDGLLDGKVDVHDFNALRTHWANQASIADIGPVYGSSPQFKLDTDGKVNFEDLMIFGLNWRYTVETGGLSSSKSAMVTQKERSNDIGESVTVDQNRAGLKPSLKAGSLELEDQAKAFKERLAERPTITAFREQDAFQFKGLHEGSKYQDTRSESGLILNDTYVLTYEGTDTLATYEVSFEFDPTRFQIDQIQQRNLFEEWEGGQTVAFTNVDSVQGKVSLTSANFGVLDAISKGDTVATITFAEIDEQVDQLGFSYSYYNQADKLNTASYTINLADLQETPEQFELLQNYPNPFNPSTVLRYHVPEQAQITMEVYDVLGRRVAQLINKQQQPGFYQLQWNAAKHLASGVYFYRLQASNKNGRNFQQVKKMMLIK